MNNKYMGVTSAAIFLIVICALAYMFTAGDREYRRMAECIGVGGDVCE